MRQWVVGFAIDPEARTVALVRKNRPPWMAGMLNGVGGKVEEGEPLVEAMRREFVEETGVFWVGWEEFVRLIAVSTEDLSGVITEQQGLISFFRAFVPNLGDIIRSMTDEPVGMYSLQVLWSQPVVPNLHWLVPLAAHTIDRYDLITVVELSTTLRVQPDGMTGEP